MAKGALFLAIAFVVGVIGMLVYPSVHLSINSAPTTGNSLTDAGMIVLAYGFLFFIGYAIYRARK